MFKKILNTQTIRQSAITLVATGLNGILAVLFYFPLARLLGSRDYGIFTLVATTTALAAIIFELGGDRGLVKFVSQYHLDQTAQRQISRLIFNLKTIIGLLLCILTLVFARPLSVWLFHQPGLTIFIPLIGFGILSSLLYFFSFYYFQAHEKFIHWGGLMVGTNLLRLVFIGVFLLVGRLSAVSTVGIYAFMPMVGFLVSLKYIDRGIFKVRGSLTRFREVFTFNKYVTAFTIISAVSSRLDTYITAGLVSLSAVGIYGLGTQAVNFLPQVISAVGAVTSPKLARFTDRQANQTYVFKAVLLSAGIALLAATVMIPGGWLLFWVTGGEFVQGFIPYLIILLSMLVFLVTGPIRDSLLYFFNKPHFFVLIGILHGITVIVSGLLLIPHLGILGSALSNLFGQLVLTLFSIGYYFRLNSTTMLISKKYEQEN